ncbi:MAG: hypothetical protein GOV02_04455 [Candidatus Aenigmarchaeota archaeon]|nr:hypothetical protein [Candidatus Aenigmarchaeota archaeon]
MDYLKKIIDLGVLVEPDAVEKMKTLSAEDLSSVISKIENERPLILSENVINQYLKKTKMIVLKQINPKSSFSVQDFVDEINERYSFLQNILLGKINNEDMVSINKCGRGRASVIGMVKNIEEKDDTFVIDVEDTTGSIQTVIQKEQGKRIEKDDVIAITGNINNKILFATNVVFPDVPLGSPNKSETETRVGFIVDHSFEKCPEIDADYLILYNCENISHVEKDLPFVKLIVVNGDKDPKVDNIDSPCLIDIDGIKILLAIGNDSLKTLKKRYVIQNNAFFALDPVPDIVFTEKSIDSTQVNYKGISIIQRNNVVNLAKREISEIILV